MDKKDQKKNIIEAARRVIGKQGVQGATIRAISIEAKVSTGSFYHYFSSKEEVLYSVMDESLSVASQISKATKEKHTDPSLLIDEIAENILKRIKKNSDNKIQFYLAKEAMLGDKALQEKFKEKYGEWLGQTKSLLQYIYNKPETKYDDALTALLIGAIDGVALQALLKANTASLEDIAKVYELLLREGLPHFFDLLLDLDKSEN